MTTTLLLLAVGILLTCSAAAYASYESTILGDSPSSYWRLGESSGSTAADSSGNGHSCTYGVTGVTLGVTGALTSDPNTAIALSAPGIVSCPSSSSITGTQAFTYEAWVRTTTSTGFQYLISQRDSETTGSNGETTFLIDNGKLELFTWDGSYQLTVASPETISDGRWHYVVATRNSEGAGTLYIDGKEVASSAGTGITKLQAHRTYLGDDGRASTNYLAGNLDEVAIYPTALTPETIKTHYTVGRPVSSYESTVLASSPSSYWRLGEASGSTAADSSGNGHSCTYGATGVTLAVTGALTGDPNTAIGLTSPGIVSCPSSSSITGTQAFTYEAWVRTSTGTGYQYLVSQRDSESTGSNGETTFLIDNGKLELFTWDGSYQLTVASPERIDDGNWHYVVATRNSEGVGTLYIDGKEVATSAGSGITKLQAHRTYLGGDGRDNTNYLTGDLDEVAVYPTALTPETIKTHYTVGHPAVTYQSTVLGSSPTSYWRLGESSGSTAADASGYGHSCTYGATGVTLGVTGALTGDPNTAIGLASPGIVSCPSSSSITGTQAFTYEAWVRTTTSTGFQYLISQRDSETTGSNGETTFLINSGKLELFTWDGSFQLTVKSPGTISDGSWHYVVATRNSEGAGTLYIDGKEVASSAGSGITKLQAHRTYLGGDGRGNTNYLTGDLDEVAIYPTALTPETIEHHYVVGTS